MRRIEHPCFNGACKSRSVGERIFRVCSAQRAYRSQRHLRLAEQFVLAPLHFCVGRHAGLPPERIFDCPARCFAGLDHLFRPSGVMSFAVTDDVYDVRIEGHLEVNRSRKVTARGVWLERIAEKPRAGLFKDFDIVCRHMIEK